MKYVKKAKADYDKKIRCELSGSAYLNHDADDGHNASKGVSGLMTIDPGVRSRIASGFTSIGFTASAWGFSVRFCGAGLSVFCPFRRLNSLKYLASVGGVTLYAMGASQEADGIMERTGDFIERKAQFLRPNFKALQTERAIGEGNTDAAREWLTVYANRSSRLPFYQLCRHFATLRSYIAVKEYAAAAFGMWLQILAVEYRRPLDHIESGLLTAIALWHNGEKNKSVNEIADAAGLGRGTVKSHVLLAYKRLGVHSAQEAVVKAKMLGLLE